MMNMLVDVSSNKDSVVRKNAVLGMEYMKRLMPGNEDRISDIISDADTDVDAIDASNGFIGTLITVEG